MTAACAQTGDDAKPAEKPPRAARSVHLGWQAPEATAFYNELNVEESVPGSYFMAAGFRHGYFGIQEQASGRKVRDFFGLGSDQGKQFQCGAGGRAR